MSKLSEYSKFDHLIIDDDDDDDNNNDNVVAVTDQSSTARSESTSTQMSSSDQDIIRHVRKHPISTNNNTSPPNTNLQFMVQYNGNTVYEWEQSLNEVIIYIISPIQNDNNNKNNISNAKIFCHISATHLQVGIQQQQQQQQQPSDMKQYYIDEDIYHPIDIQESTWCMEQEDITEMNSNQQQQQQRDVITIYLQKVAKGMVWESPLRGHTKTSGTTTGSSGNDNYHNKLDPISLQDVQRALLLERWQEENPGMDFRDATFNGGNIPDPRTYMGGIGYE
jgi:hypothetical protein